MDVSSDAVAAFGDTEHSDNRILLILPQKPIIHITTQIIYTKKTKIVSKLNIFRCRKMVNSEYLMGKNTAKIITIKFENLRGSWLELVV